MSLVVKNGTIYDPANRIEGEKVDIFIKNGKIITEDEAARDAKIIDASGKIIFPGGICIHSHIAGSNVNIGRLLRPEDMKRVFRPRRGFARSETGSGVPTTVAVGQRFARMGYSLVCEPSAVPLKSKHTHEELHDTPFVDKLAYTCFEKNWVIMRLLAADEIERAAAFAAWLLRATKMFAIKLVNPGGTEAWAWGGNVETLDQPVPHWGISSREIITGCAKINEMLNLPHSIHLHANMLGVPGNYAITQKSFEAVNDIIKGSQVMNRDTVLHMTHVGAFNAFGGESWKDVCSRTDNLAKFMNGINYATLDSGSLVFGDWTTMTADGPVEYQLHRMNNLKWTNNDAELETGAGVVPYVYSPKSLVNAIMWAMGLELHLLIDDPWKCMLTTDHPNAGPFTLYPQIMAWLMSKKYRDQTFKTLHKATEKRTIITTLDREFTLSDIAIATRAAQAKSLGLKEKGHLGPGADADVAIYSIDPENDNPAKDPDRVMKAFSNAAYTIIGGALVAKDGEIVARHIGKTYWVDPKVDSGFEQTVLAEQRLFLEQYYSVNMRNFAVLESYLTNSTPIKTPTTLT